jgi:hypothetical protein
VHENSLSCKGAGAAPAVLRTKSRRPPVVHKPREDDDFP